MSSQNHTFLLTIPVLEISIAGSIVATLNHRIMLLLPMPGRYCTLVLREMMITAWNLVSSQYPQLSA